MTEKRMGYILEPVENQEGIFTAWSRRSSSGKIIVSAITVGKPLVVTSWSVDKEIQQLERLKKEQGVDADGYTIGEGLKGDNYIYHGIQFYRITEQQN